MGDNNNFDDIKLNTDTSHGEDSVSESDSTAKTESIQNEDNAFSRASSKDIVFDATIENSEIPSTDYSCNTDETFESPIVTEGKKKKPKTKFIAAAVILAVVLIGSVTAFANRGAIANTFALMTKSPLEYYTTTEINTINKGIDAYTAVYGKALKEYKDSKENGFSQDINLKLTVNPQFTSLMELGSFESLEANINAQVKGTSSVDYTMGLLYNSQALATLNSYVNYENNEVYLQIPELSSAYLYYSIDSLMSEYGDDAYSLDYSDMMKKMEELLDKEVLSSDTINTLLKKYSSAAINKVSNVTMEKNFALNASGVSGTYTKLVVSYSEEDLYNMLVAILEAAKEDNTLKSLITEVASISEGEFTTTIETALADLKNNTDFSTDSLDDLIMNVYVDHNGRIIGRDFSLKSGTTTDTFGYYVTNQGSKIGFTAWLTMTGEKILDFSGNGSYSVKGFTGTSTLIVSTYDYTYSQMADTTINIALDNVKLEGEKGLLNGKFTLSSPAFAGVEFGLECKSDDNQQQFIFDVSYGSIQAATLDITSKKGTYKNIDYPTSSDEVYDASTDILSYMSAMDIEGFMTRIETITGIDIESLIDSLTYGGLY